MRKRTIWSACAGSIILALVVPSSAIASTSGKDFAIQDDFIEMTQSVRAQVLDQYPHAYLVEVDGASSTGPAHSASEIDHWKYVFNNVTNSAREAIFATVGSGNPEADIMVKPHNLWVGSDPLNDAPSMDLGAAFKLLHDNGHDEGFTVVTYRKPNAGGPTPHPLFIFGGPTLKHHYLTVDAVTGDIGTLQ